MTLCFLTLGTIGTEKENSDPPFLLVPCPVWGKRKGALDHSSCSSLLHISWCILSHSPFLTAAGKTPFLSDAFPKKKCSFLVSLLSTQGAPFCPISDRSILLQCLKTLYSTTKKYQKRSIASLHQEKYVSDAMAGSFLSLIHANPCLY